MKKILVTTLALSLAVVSALDARVQKVTRRRGASTPTTQKEVARSMNANAADLQNPNVPKVDKKDAASELLALFQNNPDEAQLAKLYIQRKQKMNEIQAKKDAIKAMNVGWFDFSNVDYKKAKGELGTLNTELKDINQQIAAQEKVVGRETSNAVRNAVGALIIGLGLYALDQYFGGTVTTFITTKGGELVSGAGRLLGRARIKAGELSDAYLPEGWTGAAARQKAADDAALIEQQRINIVPANAAEL